MKTVLKAKIQEITVTEANIEYEGSITIDQDILDELGLCENEQVYVNSKTGGGRIMTYLIAGKRGSKCCCLNGGAANHFRVGEIVHVLAFVIVGDDKVIEPKIYKQ